MGLEIKYEVIDEGYAAFIDGDKVGELHRDVERGWGWKVYIKGHRETGFRSTLSQAKNAMSRYSINTA